MLVILLESKAVQIIFILALIVALLYYLAIRCIDKRVKSTSKVLAKLLEINNTFDFYNLKDNFKINKSYDNKTSFNKIEPSYLMTAEIKNNMAWFSKYVSQMIENREMNAQYTNQVDHISLSENSVVYSKFKIFDFVFCEREKALFKQIKKRPTIDCSVIVKMSYSSPKRKVNLHKQNSFNFDDLFICFNSISRSYLDRKTIQALHLVERGELSDSLRYDILSRDNFTCVICGASAKQGAKLHVDHIIPVSKGGKSVPENLRTLCERCNMGKSDKIETVQPYLSENVVHSKLTCDVCGGELIVRTGKYGKFYGCSNFPKCRFTKNFDSNDLT